MKGVRSSQAHRHAFFSGTSSVLLRYLFEKAVKDLEEVPEKYPSSTRESQKKWQDPCVTCRAIKVGLIFWFRVVLL
jgi:hypothetical protein